MNEAIVLGSGTSQGIPVIGCHCDVCQSQNPKDKRLRSSILLTIKGKNYVIDTGPDFRQQMLRENIQELEAVIFTHEHKDHVAGLDDVRAFNFKQKRDMPVFASERVITALKREFSYIFENSIYPGVPKIAIQEIKNQPFLVDTVSFLPIEVMHHKLPVFGFRINDFVYITDAKTVSKEERQKLKGVDILFVNALRLGDHISHFNLQEALDFIADIQPKKAYLTHLSHLIGTHDEVTKMLPDNVEVAFDGMRLFFD